MSIVSLNMTTFHESDAVARSNTFTAARTTKVLLGLIGATDGIYKDELTSGLDIFDKII